MPATASPPRPAPQDRESPGATPRSHRSPASSAASSGQLLLGGLGIPQLIAWRSSTWSVEGPNRRFMRVQGPLWNLLEERYFRLEMGGWERLPTEPSLLIGVHSGGSLTMDAWTLCHQWWRHFGEQRVLHGTAHDGLMAAPGLGDYMRAAGTIPAKRDAIEAALGAGHDVVLWPGGEVDAMRTWRKRDQVELGGRTGWVRLAIRTGVPIVPVATIGGPETVFILSEGKRLAKLLRLKALLRTERLPITLGIPFGIAFEILPTHVPLPAKIRTELLDPVYLDADPERASDRDYVNDIYHDVERRIQTGIAELATHRRLPVFA
jgi:1-acyl-sn-glycerol-3-phosphate acyltransferase